MSDHGRRLLSEWEGGAQPFVYRDSGGAPTIGVGHCLTLSERRSGKIHIGNRTVRYAEGLSLDECEALFAQDLAPVEEAIERDVKVPISQNQIDALCSFVFNIGIGAFEDVNRSMPGKQPCSLLRYLNAGAYRMVPVELRKWVFDAGVVNKGLKNRREKEVALWEGRL